MPTSVRSHSFGIAVFILCICVSTIAAYGVIQQITLLPTKFIQDRLQSHKPVAAETLQPFLQSRYHNASLYQDPGNWEVSAMGEAAQIKDDPQALDRAIVAQHKSLMLAPANSYGWTRLSALLLQRDGGKLLAAKALENARITAPNEGRLLNTQAALAVVLSAKISPEVQARIPLLLKQAYQYDQEFMVKLARHYHFVDQLQQAIKDH